MTKKLSVLLFGVFSYSLGVSALVGWILTMLGVLNFQVGLGIYQTDSVVVSLLFAFGLTSLFGIQHTIMARENFKQKISQIIPRAAERSLFVLITGALLWNILLLWPTNDQVVWSVSSQMFTYGVIGVALLGWAYLFIASFAINHFELFGLQQVYFFFRGKEQVQVPFKERLMYKFDRHPIMTGAVLGMWFTPTMTVDHLMFAGLFSLYIVFGVTVEERDLIKQWGKGYLDYKKRVKSIVPTLT